MKRRYKQNLLETFYIVTNSFTLSLDSDPQTIRSIMKNLRTVILFIENIFYNRFEKSVLNKQLWWYFFLICIAFIQQIQ